MLTDNLAGALRGMPIGTFLASVDGAGTCLTLHTKLDVDEKWARVEARAALAHLGTDLNIHVRRHRVRDLAFPSSIEKFLAHFPDDTIVYDPTRIVLRARALIAAAKAFRHQFGSLLKGIYFDSKQSSLLLVMPSAGIVRSARDLQQEASRLVAGLSGTNVGVDAGEVRAYRIQVVRGATSRNLVPVDAASASLTWRAKRLLRSGWAPATIAVTLVSLALPAAAARNEPSGNRHPQGTPVTPPSADFLAKFGVLGGLSVFGGGPRDDAFTTKGLQGYFGDPDEQLAQAEKWNSPDRGTIQGQVPGPAS